MRPLATPDVAAILNAPRALQIEPREGGVESTGEAGTEPQVAT